MFNAVHGIMNNPALGMWESLVWYLNYLIVPRSANTNKMPQNRRDIDPWSIKVIDEACSVTERGKMIGHHCFELQNVYSDALVLMRTYGEEPSRAEFRCCFLTLTHAHATLCRGLH